MARCAVTAIHERVAGVTCGGDPVGMELVFDADDPLAIGFGFVDDDGPYEWTVSRDLVFDAACGKTVGAGDIRMWPVTSCSTGMVLSSNSGEQLLTVPTRTLLNFVRGTFKLIPRSHEQKQVDAALDALLAEVAS